MIRQLDSRDAAFDEQMALLLALPEDDRREVRARVERIIGDVRDRGDAALVELTNRFDGQSVVDAGALRIGAERLKQAFDESDARVRDALVESVDRVRQYHERQLAASGGGEGWRYTDGFGNSLGQLVRGLERVGIYAPGGRAAYPSTVVMTAIPARVAGVGELVLCTPATGGELNHTLLAAAHLCGIDQVFALGGAQAIAAMAYGTASVPKVDKIAGPGNVYVATAKALVFGDVGIDMLAGPSELVIVADDTADPCRVLQDLFAQAEHDELARAIVISPAGDLLARARALLPSLLARQSRRGIIAAAIGNRGGLVRVRDLDEAFTLVNRIAPEHLQLAIAEPEAHLGRVRHAGAVFLGVDTAEVVGDYIAGPSHVLPTGGSARFASPLGVFDFQVRSSVIGCSPEGAVRLNSTAAVIAREEGLDAHAESALSRVKD